MCSRSSAAQRQPAENPLATSNDAQGASWMAKPSQEFYTMKKGGDCPLVPIVICTGKGQSIFALASILLCAAADWHQADPLAAELDLELIARLEI
jgi:hypothetical protein